ncbi:MAG: glycosyltransferase [Clostridium sp.]|nr:glycosyltransferase [Clostridium sp.]
MRPKISIITITFNSEKTLHRAIDSVISQDYSELEYIIVDGGSKDSTVEIIKSYGEQITKWVSEPDNGISNAFNKGIAMATGDIIGIINSDDGLEPGALSAVASAYEEGIDVYRGKVLLWKEDSDTKAIETPSMHFDFSGFNKISHQSTFVTKSAYECYGHFDELCKYVMDYDLLLRYEKAGAKFKYIDEVLAFYSLGGLTFTKMTKTRIDEIKYVIHKNGGTKKDLIRYDVFVRCKEIFKRIFPKEVRMKIRNAN